MALLEYQTYRAETEQVLLSSGYSELWLEQAAEGHAAQKASIMACVTSELASAMVSFRAAWETYRPTDEERLLSLQIAYILLNPYPRRGRSASISQWLGPARRTSWMWRLGRRCTIRCTRSSTPRAPFRFTQSLAQVPGTTLREELLCLLAAMGRSRWLRTSSSST